MKQATKQSATLETRDNFIKMIKDSLVIVPLEVVANQTVDVITTDNRLYQIISETYDASLNPKGVTLLNIKKGDTNTIKVNGQRIDFNPADLHTPVYEHNGKKYFGTPKRSSNYWG